MRSSLSSPRRSVTAVTALTAILLALAPFAAPDRAAAQRPDGSREGPHSGWTHQWSSRLGTGFGAELGTLDHHFVMENHIRTDVLFGKVGAGHMRIGPTFELRGSNFHSAELAVGPMWLIPTHRGWPLQLSVSGGYAFRFDDANDPRDLSGLRLVSTAAWGLRSYNYHSHYGTGVNFFVTHRTWLDDASNFEVTGGIELDLQLAIGIPILFIRMLTQNDDPDEPEEAEEDEAGNIDYGRGAPI